MNWMVNYIQLAWKLAYMLRIYRTCNSIAGFSKYEFYNKLLGGVILLRITPGVTWIQPYIYVDTHLWFSSFHLFEFFFFSLFMFFKRPSYRLLFFSFLSVYHKVWKGLETPTYSKCFIFTSMFLTSLLDKDFNPLVQRNFSLLS